MMLGNHIRNKKYHVCRSDNNLYIWQAITDLLLCFPESGAICTKLSIIAEAGVYNITTIDSGYFLKKYKHLKCGYRV